MWKLLPSSQMEPSVIFLQWPNSLCLHQKPNQVRYYTSPIYVVIICLRFKIQPAYHRQAMPYSCTCFHLTCIHVCTRTCCYCSAACLNFVCVTCKDFYHLSQSVLLLCACHMTHSSDSTCSAYTFGIFSHQSPILCVLGNFGVVLFSCFPYYTMQLIQMHSYISLYLDHFVHFHIDYGVV